LAVFPSNSESAFEVAVAWLNTVVPTGITVSVDGRGMIEISRPADGPPQRVLPRDDLHTRLWILLSEVQDFIQMRSHERWPDPSHDTIPDIDDSDDGLTIGYRYNPPPRPAGHLIERDVEPWCISHSVRVTGLGPDIRSGRGV
jgi:hypothetical protein